MATTKFTRLAECQSIECLECRFCVRQDQRICCIALHDTYPAGVTCPFFKQKEEKNDDEV